MQKLTNQFWRLTRQVNRLKDARRAALKKWNFDEVGRLDKLISHNNKTSDLLIEQMKQVAA